MNKQKEHLISADKLLEWLEDKFRTYPQERMGDYGAGQDALDMVATAVENGTFDPDPIPLPALKPGDKVRHKDHEQWGIGKVLELSKSKSRRSPSNGKKSNIYAVN